MIMLAAFTSIARIAALQMRVHPEFLKWLELALNDTELLCLIEAWGRLSSELRKAITALLKVKEAKISEK